MDLDHNQAHYLSATLAVSLVGVEPTPYGLGNRCASFAPQALVLMLPRLDSNQQRTLVNGQALYH